MSGLEPGTIASLCNWYFYGVADTAEGSRTRDLSILMG